MLIQLDDRDYRSRLERIKANYRLARLDYDRTMTLATVLTLVVVPTLYALVYTTSLAPERGVKSVRRAYWTPFYRLTGTTPDEETALALENIRIILEEAGSSLNNLLQVRVYLVDIREYGRFNEVYKRYFQKDLPARTCIQASKLPFDIRVEIDAIGFI